MMARSSSGFPFPPTSCAERGCPRVTISTHWESGGYQATHEDADPFLVSAEAVTASAGLWPPSALREIDAIHRRQDEQAALALEAEKAAIAPEQPAEEAVAPERSKRRRRKKDR